jgi:hypothetical protein
MGKLHPSVIVYICFISEIIERILIKFGIADT